jgi:N-methylhydantoinase B
MILDPLHPMNAGAMRPFHVLAATGSVVMGTPPTSNSQHAEIATKIAPLSLRLVGNMVPGRAVAADGGTTHAHILGGIDQRPGREGLPFGAGCTQGIGWGGSAGADGISFCSTPIFGISASVIEFLERDAPVMVRSTNGVVDSAGPGRHRSGYGNSILLECADGEVFISTILDSGRFARPGAEGGGHGMTSYLFRMATDDGNRIPQSNGLVPLDHLSPLAGRFDEEGRPDSESGDWGRGTEFQTTKLTNLVLKAGEVLFVLAPTGGGYGDPFERDPEAVRLDVWNEHLSVDAAARQYGVVVDPSTFEVDEDGTRELRARRGPDVLQEVGGYRPWPKTKDELPTDAARLKAAS